MASPIVPWLALFVSLLTAAWNIYDKVSNNRRQKSKYIEDYRRAQWSGLKNALQAALTEFDQASDDVHISVVTMSPQDERLVELHAKIVRKQDRLAMCLKACDESTYIDQRDWQDLAFGRQVDDESSWDKIDTLLGSVSNAKSQAEAMEIKKDLTALVREITKPIESKIRCEDRGQDPIHAK